MASSSRMTAATTCSCTSVPLNAPALERCVKARRSPTKSWQIVALANPRPTIYAPPDKRFPRGHEAFGNCSEIEKAAPDGAVFLLVLNELSPRSQLEPVSMELKRALDSRF